MSRPFEKTDMPIPLTDDALRDLYQRSSNVPEWESWRKRYGAFGSGESVNVDGAYQAPDNVQSHVSRSSMSDSSRIFSGSTGSARPS